MFSLCSHTAPTEGQTWDTRAALPREPLPRGRPQETPPSRGVRGGAGPRAVLRCPPSKVSFFPFKTNKKYIYIFIFSCRVAPEEVCMASLCGPNLKVRTEACPPGAGAQQDSEGQSQGGLAGGHLLAPRVWLLCMGAARQPAGPSALANYCDVCPSPQAPLLNRSSGPPHLPVPQTLTWACPPF